MADTLTRPLNRRSPLQDYVCRFAELTASTNVAEEPFVTMVDLWVDPDGPGSAAAAAVLGIPALPSTPSTVISGRHATVHWFGPQEWLVTTLDRSGEVLETQLREVVSEHGGAAVDVSAQRTALRLHGERARDVLAKGCSLDLHPRVFGPGSVAQTMLGLAAVVLIPLDNNGTDYRILVRQSFARYLAQWLIDAAEEYSVDW